MVLLNALVVISLVAAIATQLIRSDLIARNRYELMLRSDQARVYARAAEALALELLTLDAEDSEIDSLNEAWAVPDRQFEIEGAVLTGRLHDLQGRLNINRILRAPEEGGDNDTAKPRWVLSEPEFQVLKSLIQNAEGPGTLATRMVEWMSDGVDGLPGAAGDAPYLKGEHALLRPARAVLSPVEFRPVEGMTAAVFTALTQSLAALPGETSLNINTAPRAVLQALVPGLSPTLLDRLLRDRKANPFQTRVAFDNYLAKIVPPDTFTEIAALDIDVTTNWFLLEIDVIHGSARARLYSVIRRSGDGAAQVFLRSGARL